MTSNTVKHIHSVIDDLNNAINRVDNTQYNDCDDSVQESLADISRMLVNLEMRMDDVETKNTYWRDLA